MTISKERLSELALEVGKSQYEDDFHKWPEEYTQRVIDFAHALLKRVEEEAEVIAFLHDQRFLQFTNGGKKDALKLIALPLVSSEE